MLIVAIVAERIVRAPSEMAHAVGLFYAVTTVDVASGAAAHLACHAGQWFTPQITGTLRWTEVARA